MQYVEVRLDEAYRYVTDLPDEQIAQPADFLSSPNRKNICIRDLPKSKL